MPPAPYNYRRISFAGRPSVAAGGVAAQLPALEEQQQAVLHIGKDTLYRRGKTLIAANASDVDLDNSQDIVEIERFSPDYFALIAANSKAENALLARQAEDQELIVRLRGKTYRIK